VGHLLNIAERFQPNTVLWAFHTIQPSSIVLSWWLIHVAWCTLYLSEYTGMGMEISPYTSRSGRTHSLDSRRRNFVIPVYATVLSAMT